MEKGAGYCLPQQGHGVSGCRFEEDMLSVQGTCGQTPATQVCCSEDKSQLEEGVGNHRALVFRLGCLSKESVYYGAREGQR